MVAFVLQGELNSCNGDHMAHNLEIFTIFPYKENFARLSRANPFLDVEFDYLFFLIFHFSNQYINIFLYPSSIISILFCVHL